MAKQYDLRDKIKFEVRPFEAENESAFLKLRVICLDCSYYLRYGLCSHRLVEPGLDETWPRIVPNAVIRERRCRFYENRNACAEEKSECRTTDKQSVIEITWTGPFAWPSFEIESNLPRIPKKPGVYLQTFEYKNGYLIYAAGITRRSVYRRFTEHTKQYMTGNYTVFDIKEIKKGVRKEIWHGWGYAREHREEFEERKSTILEAVIKQLSAFRIFTTDMGNPQDKQRLYERLEASIMQNIYQQPLPFCDIPDKGMQLAPRRDSEIPIIIKNKCPKLIHRLPAIITI